MYALQMRQFQDAESFDLEHEIVRNVQAMQGFQLLERATWKVVDFAAL